MGTSSTGHDPAGTAYGDSGNVVLSLTPQRAVIVASSIANGHDVRSEWLDDIVEQLLTASATCLALPPTLTRAAFLRGDWSAMERRDGEPDKAITSEALTTELSDKAKAIQALATATAAEIAAHQDLRAAAVALARDVTRAQARETHNDEQVDTSAAVGPNRR